MPLLTPQGDAGGGPWEGANVQCLGRGNRVVPQTFSLTCLLLGIGLLVRLLLACVLPPGYDEAYYVFYGRHLDLSYYDHPLAVGLWSWLGQQLGGSVLALRLPSVLSYTLALALLGAATEQWFGRRALIWTLVLGSTAPLLFVCGGVLLLPDSPLLLALAWLLWWLARHRTVVPDGPAGAVELGLIMAALTLSKYHALFVLPLLLLWSMRNAAGRAGWRRPWPWLTVALWAVCSMPLWLWNARHGWVSFLFHGGRVGDGAHFSLQNGLLFLLSQLGLLFPTVGVLVLLALFRSTRAPHVVPEAQASALLRWLVIPQLLLFCLLAGRMQVLASWLVPAWWMSLPLAAAWLAHRPWRRFWIRVPSLATAAVLPPLMLLGALQTRWGILEPLLPTRRDPSAQLMAPHDLRLDLERQPQVWQALQQADLVVSHRYELPGFIALAMPRSFRGEFTSIGGDPRGFAYWDPPNRYLGRQGVVVVFHDPDRPLTSRGAYRRLRDLRPLGLVQVKRSGQASVLLEVASFGPLQRPLKRSLRRIDAGA